MHRVLDCGRSVVVELTETVDIGGSPLETPEVLVFDFDAENRIVHIAIYIQRLARSPRCPDGHRYPVVATLKPSGSSGS